MGMIDKYHEETMIHYTMTLVALAVAACYARLIWRITQ